MLELKREDRFTSIDDAISHLSHVSAEKSAVQVLPELAAENDDLDLLEIPVEPKFKQTTNATNGYADAFVDEIAAISAVEVTPESASHAEELDSFVQQFYSHGPAARRFTEENTTNEREEVIDDDEPIVETVEKKYDAPAFSIAAEPSSQNVGFGKMIGIAVAGIVVVAITGFGLLSLTSSSEESKSQDQPTNQAPTTSVSSAPEQPPVNSPETTNQVSTSADTTQQVVTDQPENRPAATKSRPQVAEVKPAKSNDTKPSAKPDQKTKKKMTVDDLLN